MAKWVMLAMFMLQNVMIRWCRQVWGRSSWWCQLICLLPPLKTHPRWVIESPSIKFGLSACQPLDRCSPSQERGEKKNLLWKCRGYVGKSREMGVFWGSIWDTYWRAEEEFCCEWWWMKVCLILSHLKNRSCLSPPLAGWNLYAFVRYSSHVKGR